MNYTYVCSSCKKKFDLAYKITVNRKLSSKECCQSCRPDEDVKIENPAIVSMVQGISRSMPSDYRYLHNRIKKANIGSTLPDM